MEHQMEYLAKEWHRLRDFLVPPTRIPIDLTTLWIFLLPQIFVGLHAFLNVVRAPRWLHFALWPFTAVCVIKCHASIYFAEPGWNIYNQLVGVAAFLMLVKSVDWTFFPSYRCAPPGINRAPPPSRDEDERPKSLFGAIYATYQLVADLRGVTHTFGARYPFPHTARARNVFLVARFFSLIGTFLLLDSLRTLVRFFGPLGTPEGGSIFLPSLSPHPVQQWTLALFLTLCVGGAIYSYMSSLHSLVSLLEVGLLGEPPEEWPRLFNRPWLTSSLTDFWGRRWHQLFRRVFVVCSLPFQALAGSAGGALGAFLASGVMHEAGARCMGRGSSGWRTVGFFLLQGLGCVLEVGFRWLTGRRAGGVWGRVWTWCWLLGWGTLLADVYARRGMAGGTLYPEWASPWERALNAYGVYTRPRE